MYVDCTPETPLANESSLAVGQIWEHLGHDNWYNPFIRRRGIARSSYVGCDPVGRPKVSLCICHPWRILVSHSVRNRQIGNGFSIRHMYIRDAVCLFRVSLCMLHAKIWRPREERDTHPRCIEFVIHM